MNTIPAFYDTPYNGSSASRETVTKSKWLARSLVDRPIPGISLVAPTPATRADLALAHGDEYVDAVLTGTPTDLANSSGVGAWDEGLARSILWSTGGVIDAVSHVITHGGAACSLSSGLHHARRDSGRGFCTVNGLAVAARRAILAGAARVLVVDLDAHGGGGTARIISGQPEIEQIDVSVDSFDHYCSQPNATFFPAWNVRSGDEYLFTVETALGVVADPGSIDVVLYNAGVDVHGQAGGIKVIDTDTVRRRDRMVFEWAKGYGVPVAWVLAGGYNTGIDMDGLVDLHRIAFEEAAAVFG